MNVVHGNLLDVTQGVVLHGVNAQGRFDAGIAKQFRQKYHQVYKDYMARHESPRGLHLGDVIPTAVSEQLLIISGVTQTYYGRSPTMRYVDYPAVSEVFHQAARAAAHRQQVLHFPMIGAGLANGDWYVIQELIEVALHEHQVLGTLYFQENDDLEA